MRDYHAAISPDWLPDSCRPKGVLLIRHVEQMHHSPPTPVICIQHYILVNTLPNDFSLQNGKALAPTGRGVRALAVLARLFHLKICDQRVGERHRISTQARQYTTWAGASPVLLACVAAPNRQLHRLAFFCAETGCRKTQTGAPQYDVHSPQNEPTKSAVFANTPVDHLQSN